MKMEKNKIEKMINRGIISFCVIILLTMPLMSTAGQQPLSKINQAIESLPNYHVIMFGRIFNPHVENNKLCFKAINVICLIDDFYDDSGRVPYYLEGFRDVKIPTYYFKLHAFGWIFVHTGCNDLPEF
jgi:hypothetical protein